MLDDEFGERWRGGEVVEEREEATAWRRWQRVRWSWDTDRRDATSSFQAWRLSPMSVAVWFRRATAEEEEGSRGGEEVRRERMVEAEVVKWERRDKSSAWGTFFSAMAAPEFTYEGEEVMMIEVDSSFVPGLVTKAEERRRLLCSSISFEDAAVMILGVGSS